MPETVGRLVFIPEGQGFTGAPGGGISGAGNAAADSMRNEKGGFMGGVKGGMFGGGKDIAKNIELMVGGIFALGLLFKPLSEIVDTLLKPVLQIMLIFGLRAFMAIIKWLERPGETPIERAETNIKNIFARYEAGEITISEAKWQVMGVLSGTLMETLVSAVLKPIGTAMTALNVPNLLLVFIRDNFLAGFDFGATLAGIVSWIVTSLTTADNWKFETLTGVGKWIKTVISNLNIWDFPKLTDIGAWMVKTIEDVAMWGLDTLKELGKWLFETIQGIVNTILSSLTLGIFGGKKQGGGMVPEGMTPKEYLESRWADEGGGGDGGGGGRGTGAGYAPGHQGDFIMRRGQAPVSFSPDDTIMGFKGGGGMGGGITINVNNPVLMNDEAIRTLTSRISDELATGIRGNSTY